MNYKGAIMGWDLSNILSAIGILASAINTIIVIYIYTKWTTQKQKEVIANDANILLEEIDSLRKKIVNAHKENTVDTSFISYIEQKKYSIGHSLRIIKNVDKNLVYEHYIDALSVLITALQVNPESIIEVNTIDDVLIYTIGLEFKLNDLRIYTY